MSATRATPAILAGQQFRLLSVEELLTIPAPEWQIQGLFEVGTFVVVYGAPEAGKTFLATDWALSVATGRDWMGLPVKRGSVVYVLGEGGRSSRKRVAAWMLDRDVREIADAFFLLEAVQLLDDRDVDTLLACVLELPQPALIIFDTLATCFVDGDDNTSRDIGRLVHAARLLQDETGATVLLLHHTNKQDDRTERGSNALRAGSDTMILVRANNRLVTLSNTKQKDHDKFSPIDLQLKTVAAGVDDAGVPMTSCVLESAAQTGPSVTPSSGQAMAALTALAVLAASPNGTARSGAWKNAISPPVAPRTFQHWRAALLVGGYVQIVPGLRGVYKVTDSGTAMLLQHGFAPGTSAQSAPATP